MSDQQKSDQRKNVAVLGSTGSIGRSAAEVFTACSDRLRPVALTAHRRVPELAEQARRLQPRYVVISDEEAAAGVARQMFPADTRLLVGEAGLAQVVALPEVDVVLAAIVGRAGLESTWAAVEAGKTIALANKETLVMAGPLVTKLAERSGSEILPVDSEHSAVFQALRSGRRHEVRRIILTASGGPFLNYTLAELADVTVDDALAHPTWDMGPKITVDSATMMNKALEIVEARWLFDLSPEQIDVVIHPQSIVHSLVEFVDGSVVAQMSPPDMKLPIQHALTWPDRIEGAAPRLDLTDPVRLDLHPPDLDRFEALRLGHEAARAGGTAGAVLNAANEAAVAGFLAGDLPFAEITTACRSVLEHHDFDPAPSLADLSAIDRWAREEVSRWVCT
ncbi:MAG: 1-deoxy-D-xylulose-5-phosphate reductoisomerase [Planctomycetota bacterium]|nr:MAG: 1-deoxy-D-xylulose-5-phosphate reductoisomerase [Planctomycetota bacterium]REK21879.1 MAG: 1-deoxy-D-xylulose-5-phosphate reductoisomerase [Planctomycetota bacterium]REK46687.1 MAG: 1-deoxy-D-xylulose-5-phosphate reductoisomerase [Planctomycetota bacterium]